MVPASDDWPDTHSSALVKYKPLTWRLAWCGVVVGSKGKRTTPSLPPSLPPNIVFSRKSPHPSCSLEREREQEAGFLSDLIMHVDPTATEREREQDGNFLPPPSDDVVED